MAADSAHYRELSEGEWRALPATYLHAAHAMLYAEWPGKFLDKYDFKYAVMMQLRFDGTLGFPGGMVDAGETPEQAASREIRELTLQKLHSTESSVTTAPSWGDEVLGVVRVPLYTLPNGLGLPAFLKHQFIGTSRQQLLTALERRGLMEGAELQEAIQTGDSINY